MGVAGAVVVMETCDQTQTLSHIGRSCTHTVASYGVRKETQGEMCVWMAALMWKMKLWHWYASGRALKWPLSILAFVCVCVWMCVTDTVVCTHCLASCSLMSQFLTSFISLTPPTTLHHRSLSVQPCHHTDRRTALCVASATMHAQRQTGNKIWRMNTFLSPSCTHTHTHTHTYTRLNLQTHTHPVCVSVMCFLAHSVLLSVHLCCSGEIFKSLRCLVTPNCVCACRCASWVIIHFYGTMWLYTSLTLH